MMLGIVLVCAAGRIDNAPFIIVMTVISLFNVLLFRRSRFIYGLPLFLFSMMEYSEAHVNAPSKIGTVFVGFVSAVYYIAVLSKMGALTYYMSKREGKIEEDRMARATARGIANAGQVVTAVTPKGPRAMSRLDAMDKGYPIMEDSKAPASAPVAAQGTAIPEGYALVPEGYTLAPIPQPQMATAGAYAAPVRQGTAYDPNIDSYDYQPDRTSVIRNDESTKHIDPLF